MRFGINDVFDCLEVAFDIKKTLIFLLAGMLAGILVYISLWFSSLNQNPILSLGLIILSTIATYFICLYAGSMVSIMSYKELTSGEKISANASYSLTAKYIRSLLISPILVALIVGLIVGIQYLIFLSGKMIIGQLILSLLSIPLILLNIMLILFVKFSLIFLPEIIVIDDCGPITAVKKCYSLAKKAPLQVIMSLALVLMIGSVVIIAGAALYFFSLVLSLLLFGSASGVFAQMAVTPVTVYPLITRISWMIFGVFSSLIAFAILSFVIVYLKVSLMSIYMKVKERIK